MSLIVCKECGKKYSDKAKVCPECGCPTDYNIDVNNETLDANEELVNETPANSQNQVTFVLEDQKIVFDEEIIKYGDVRRKCLEYAVDNMDLDRWLDLFSIDDMEPMMMRMDEDILGISDVVLEIFMSFGIDDLDKQHIRSELKDYFSYHHFKPIVEALDGVAQKQNDIFQKRFFERNQRSYWQGGGFGIKGAIKGKINASILNAGTNILRGVGDSVSDMLDDMAINKYQMEQFDNIDEKIPRIIFDFYVENSLAASSYIIDVLVERLKLSELTFLPDKARGKFNNYSDLFAAGRIAEQEFARVIIDCMQLYPFEAAYYETFFNITSDRTVKMALRRMAMKLGVFIRCPALDAKVTEILSLDEKTDSDVKEKIKHIKTFLSTETIETDADKAELYEKLGLLSFAERFRLVFSENCMVEYAMDAELLKELLTKDEGKETLYGRLAEHSRVVEETILDLLINLDELKELPKHAELPKNIEQYKCFMKSAQIKELREKSYSEWKRFPKLREVLVAYSIILMCPYSLMPLLDLIDDNAIARDAVVITRLDQLQIPKELKLEWSMWREKLIPIVAFDGYPKAMAYFAEEPEKFLNKVPHLNKESKEELERLLIVISANANEELGIQLEDSRQDFVYRDTSFVQMVESSIAKGKEKADSIMKGVEIRDSKEANKAVGLNKLSPGELPEGWKRQRIEELEPSLKKKIDKVDRVLKKAYHNDSEELGEYLLLYFDVIDYIFLVTDIGLFTYQKSLFDPDVTRLLFDEITPCTIEPDALGARFVYTDKKTGRQMKAGLYMPSSEVEHVAQYLESISE